MGRLFGTDGIRGIVNAELTCELALNVGRATAIVLTEGKIDRPKIIIGKDTRLSSDMLESALIAGLCSIGADVLMLGVVPTPAVAFLVKKYKADAGIMISASHNPYEFNGIKIFSSDGYKLPDDVEEEIEEIILDEKVEMNYPQGKDIGKVHYAENAVIDYVEHIKNTLNVDLKGIRVAFDCSNGAASRTAKRLFEDLGAECYMLFDDPNGTNINDDCGSTHMNSLVEYVKSHKLDVGIAFDGDADRCLAVDENGNIIDGDFIMAICAKDLKARGKLKKDTVVGTIMTNMGFNNFCNENDLKFVSTKVGDRYVLEDMLREDYNFGGEQSGHVIFLDYTTTGDGQLTAAQLLSIIKSKKEKLSNLAKVMKRYPQVMVNVKINSDSKILFYTDEEIKKKISYVKDQLGNAGRILVRVSGTEPLIRVMLEGEDYNKITSLADEVASLIKQRLC